MNTMLQKRSDLIDMIITIADEVGMDLSKMLDALEKHQDGNTQPWEMMKMIHFAHDVDKYNKIMNASVELSKLQ